MIARFFFPTAHRLGLDVKAILRNTTRDGTGSDVEVQPEIHVNLSAYRQGEKIFESKELLVVPFGKFQEITSESCPPMSDATDDCIIVARCELMDNQAGYFPQEHQLMYIDKKSGNRSSLVYDQLPIASPSKIPEPFILIAPKAWVGTDINTYVLFSNTWDSVNQDDQSRPIVLNVMKTDGTILHTEAKTEKYNSCWIFDVKSAIQNQIVLDANPLFFTVVAKGGASTYAMTTIIRNEKTGTIAIEHSLSPHYYFTGDRKRVRNEALIFVDAKQI
jgi:hypothetical protein